MSIKRLLTSVLLGFMVLSARSTTLPADSIICDTIIFDDGSWYSGEIQDSLFNGFGTMFYSDSTIYTGQWKDGLWNGEGTLQFPDGDKYTGHFKNHEFDGIGVYDYHDGARYDGYWMDGMIHGAGTFDYADGSSYTGLWEYDRKEGIGILYDAPSNTLFKGLFHNDVFVEDTDKFYSKAIVGRPEEKKTDKENELPSYVIGATFSTENNLSFNFDFHCYKHFYAGFSIGFLAQNNRKGKESVIYDDETGERQVLVGWDWYPEEIVMEHDYNIFHLFGECELKWKHIGIGAAVGLGVTNTIRNCRGTGNSYFEAGQLYYRRKTSGASFGYRVFTDITLKKLDIQGNHMCLSGRIGYGNLDGALFGIGICF